MATLKTCINEKTLDEIMVAQIEAFTITDLNYFPWAPVVDGEFLLGKQIIVYIRLLGCNPFLIVQFSNRNVGVSFAWTNTNENKNNMSKSRNNNNKRNQNRKKNN